MISLTFFYVTGHGFANVDNMTDLIDLRYSTTWILDSIVVLPENFVNIIIRKS